MAVDLLLAEELVAMSLAAREHCGAERDACRAAVEAEARAVQVVAVANVEVEIDALGVGARRIEEDLVWRGRLLLLRE